MDEDRRRKTYSQSIEPMELSEEKNKTTHTLDDRNQKDCHTVMVLPLIMIGRTT